MVSFDIRLVVEICRVKFITTEHIVLNISNLFTFFNLQDAALLTNLNSIKPYMQQLSCGNFVVGREKQFYYEAPKSSKGTSCEIIHSSSLISILGTFHYPLCYLHHNTLFML